MTIIHSSCICLFIFNLIWRSISLSVPTRQLFYVFYDNNTYLLYLLQLLQLWKSFFSISMSTLCFYDNNTFLYLRIYTQLFTTTKSSLTLCKWQCTASQQASVCSSTVIRWWWFVYCCLLLLSFCFVWWYYIWYLLIYTFPPTTSYMCSCYCCVMYLCIISSIVQ